MMAERDFLPDTCNPNKGKTFESFQLKRTLEIPPAESLGSSIRLQKSAWRCGTAVELPASLCFIGTITQELARDFHFVL